jgi:hypothetical protein
MTNAEFTAKAAELEKKLGVPLTGPAGKITKDGVTAGYTHWDNTLTVHIIDKPFFLTTEYCEQKLQEWLGAEPSKSPV